MRRAYKAYRSLVGGTPFVTEGWSLYWELLMWDMKFQKTPEDRVGALVLAHAPLCAHHFFVELSSGEDDAG